MPSLKQGPTLATIRMVEETIRDHPDSAVTVADLKRALPRKVNHNALMEILAYLEEQHRIMMTVKGITWLTPMSEKLRRALEGAREL